MTTFNLADLWEALCDAGPDDVCLVAGGVRHTRRSLDEAANRVAHELRARDVVPGAHVGIYARNRAECVESLLGCWKAGVVPVNINWRYVAAELRHVIEDGELGTIIVEDDYLPVLDELGFDNWMLIGEWAGRPATRIEPDVVRSGNDVYILYTGGPTGMPKGVMWRHEDFFYACCQGGNPLGPISEPSEIANNAEPAFRIDPLAIGPLMHGGGQWLTLTGLYCGGKSIVYCERSFEAEKVLDLAEQERTTAIGIIGDAMARPLAEAVLAVPDRWDLSALVTLGNGGAMLRSVVKEQLAQAFPNTLLLDSFGASETGAAGSELGADTTSDRPAFATDGRTWVLDPDTLEPLTPGGTEPGLLARQGHIPIGYWNDPAKTAATFRTDANGVRWGVARRLGDHRRARPHRSHGARFGMRQQRRREDLSRGGRGRHPRPPRRLRCGCGGRSPRPPRRVRRRGRGDPARCSTARPRNAAEPLPRVDRRLQGPAAPHHRLKPPDERGQA